MALPIQIGDEIVYSMINLKGAAQPLTVAKEEKESVIGVLLKADPNNTQTAYVGDATNQGYPLVAGETLSVKLSRRNKVYVKGTPGDKIHVLLVTTTGNRGQAYAEGWSPLDARRR